MKDLKALLNALPCPSFIVDWNRKIVFWNRECEKLTGIKEKDIIGTSDYWRLYSTSKRDTAVDILLKLSKINFNEVYEATIECENKIFKSFAFALPSGIVEIAQDITKLRKFENKLYFYNNIIKYMIKFSTCNNLECMGVILVDMAKNLLNIKACEVYEYDEDLFRLVVRHPNIKGDEVMDDSNPIAPLIKNIVNSKVNFLKNLHTGVFGEYCKRNNLECLLAPLVASDKLVGFIRVAFKPDNEQVIKEELLNLITKIISAILRRIKVEEELIESEKKYRELFESLGEGVILSDKDGRIVEVNESLVEMLGYSKDELIGKNIYELHKNPTEKDELISNVLKTGFIKGYRINYVRKDGKIIECLETIRIIEKDGKFAGFYEVIRDITQLKLVEEKFKRVNNLLKLSRKVSKCITREKSKGPILTKICKILYEHGNEYFSSVWGIVKDEKHRNRVISHSKRVERVISKNLSEMKCIPFTEKGNVFLSNIHSEICKSCKLKQNCKFKIIFPIKYKNDIYGVLCFNLKKSIDEESINILGEIAEDVGFSFKSIDVCRRLDCAMEQLKRNILSIEIIADKMKNPLGVIYPLAEYILAEHKNMSDEELKFCLKVIKEQTEKLKRNFKLIEKVEKETLKFLDLETQALTTNYKLK